MFLALDEIKFFSQYFYVKILWCVLTVKKIQSSQEYESMSLGLVIEYFFKVVILYMGNSQKIGSFR